jgi:hypothetical protein
LDAPGLSVFGRAPATTGLMSSIATVLGDQYMTSSRDGSTLEWRSIGGVSHALALATPGSQDILLPSGFRSEDYLTVSLQNAGDYIIDRILDAAGSELADSFVVNLCLTNIPNAGPPATARLILREYSAAPVAGGFRVPGVFYSSLTDNDYVMASEEESARLAYTTAVSPNGWRFLGTTAAQPVTGDVDIPGGTGGPRLSTLGAVVTADKLAVFAGGSGDTVYIVPFLIRHQFAASGAGTVDIVIIPPGTISRDIQIERAWLRISTTGGTSAALRNATAGAGSVLMPDAASATRTFVTSGVGVVYENSASNFNVAAGDGLYLRCDRALAARVTLECRWWS